VVSYESNLQEDGTVFPPVTPDPPMPPGQEEIEVPEILPASEPEVPEGGDSSKGNEPPD
jgi:hypothetical protein